jgi:DNA-binding LacI/PurR family transcriptional regulator
MKTTIKDIAKLAGVSTSTVSRAMNSSGRVNAETQERIQALSKRLHYRPSSVARGLVLQHTKNILLLFPNIANAYFAEITKIISSECRQKGYTILLGDTNEDPEVEKEYLDIITEGTVDGAIIASLPGEHNLSQYLNMVQAGFPTVLLDSTMPNLKMSHVIVDNVAGAEMVVDYLASKGHSKIGFVSDTREALAFHERLEGYRRGHAKRGLALHEDYLQAPHAPLERGGVVGTDALLALEDPPTAVFALNDMVAIGCIASVLRHGLRVPEDVAVVGYDDIDLSAFIEIPLTTVAQPKQGIAQKSVDLVVEYMEKYRHKEEFAPEQHVLKPALVVRESA